MNLHKPTNKEIRRSPYLFAKTLLKILNKDMQIVPFVFNAMQADYINKRTQRDIILKPRQIGFSTLIQAELFRYVTTRTARVTTVGKDDGNTRDLRAIFNRYYDNLPDGLILNRSISNATETIFPDNDSRAIIAKAGNTSSGRGGTNYAVHLSEVAFYRDAKTLVQGITQAGNPIWIVMESTANGQTGYFYDMVMQAYTAPDSTAWRLHFYRWFDFPQYRADVPGSYSLEAHKPDEHERWLMKYHGVDLGQLLWRRMKVQEIGISAFEVEYPHDVPTAFKGTGSSVFILDNNHLGDAQPHMPDRDKTYVAGVDWGRENDYTVLSIFDVATGEEVFIDRWQKPLSYTDICNHIASVICEYGVRVVKVETNAMGSTNAEILMRQIYSRWVADGNELDTAPIVDGFATTQRTKQIIVDRFKVALESYDIKLLDISYATAELRAYQESLSPSGIPRWHHPPNGHDDTVMARMIAWLGVLQSGSLAT